VVDPKLGTDPAKRPTGGIQLRGSIHIHDQYPNFRRKPSPVLASAISSLLNSGCSGLHGGARRRTPSHIQTTAGC
jgi:hypothetical protein